MDTDKQDADDTVWASLLAGLAAVWSDVSREAERRPDDGERYLAAAREVSRGT